MEKILEVARNPTKPNQNANINDKTNNFQSKIEESNKNIASSTTTVSSSVNEKHQQTNKEETKEKKKASGCFIQ